MSLFWKNLIERQLHSVGRAFNKSKPTNSLSIALLILTWRYFFIRLYNFGTFWKKMTTFWRDKEKTLINCWEPKTADYWVKKQKKRSEHREIQNFNGNILWKRSDNCDKSERYYNLSVNFKINFVKNFLKMRWLKKE